MIDFFKQLLDPQQIVNGLSLGAIYALIALGYTMVYGVLRFINFAHSDIFMIGAFVGFYAGPKVAKVLALPSFTGALIVLIVSMLICAILGIVIERLAYRPLRNRSKLTVLITAIGVSLFLEYSGQRFFGADPKFFPEIIADSPVIDKEFKIGSPKPVTFPADSIETTAATDQAPAKKVCPQCGAVLLPSDKVDGVDQLKCPSCVTSRVVSLTIGKIDVIVFGVTIALLVALQFIVLKTKIGTAMRAVSFNAQAASLMGININVVIAFTFGLGSALAGAGGILYALKYPSIEPLMGVMPGLKAFVAAVLGGIGNIPGAALGGLIIGVVETYVAGSEWSTYRDAIAFAILILILLFKPSGILGKVQVEKV